MRTFQEALDMMYAPDAPQPAKYFRELYHEVTRNRMAAILLTRAAATARKSAPIDEDFVMLTHYWMGIVTGILMMQETKRHEQ